MLSTWATIWRILFESSTTSTVELLAAPSTLGRLGFGRHEREVLAHHEAGDVEHDEHPVVPGRDAADEALRDHPAEVGRFLDLVGRQRHHVAHRVDHHPDHPPGDAEDDHH